MSYSCRTTIFKTTLLIAALALFGWAVPAFAQLTDVELDGNVREQAATTGEDWDTSLTAPNVAGINKLSIPSAAILRTGAVLDPPGFTLFVQGSKDILDIPQWRWTDQGAPDKDEIVNGYAALYPGGKFYAGAERAATSGTSFIGIWLLQDREFATNPDGTFTGHHILGDVLILSDFTGGSGTASPRVYFWNTGAPAFGGVKVDANIESLSVSGAVLGKVNFLRLKPKYWTYTGKFPPKDSIPPTGFFEGGVDFNGAGIPFPCAFNVLIETRSSSSITAEQKDFLFHSFLIKPFVTINSAKFCKGDSARLCATVTGGFPSFSYVWTGPPGFVDPGNISCFVTSTLGTYCVYVTGSNGCTDTVCISDAFDYPLCPQFGLLSPAANVSVPSNQPLFLWESLHDSIQSIVANYKLFLSTNTSFTPADTFATANDTFWQAPIPLDFHKTYFWKVMAVTDSADTFFTQEIRMLKVSDAVPGGFSLISPLNNGKIVSKSPVLSWSPAIDPDPLDTITYTLTLSADSQFQIALNQPGLTAISYSVPPGILTRGVQYYWKVKALDASDSVSFSNEIFRFRLLYLGDVNGDGILSPADIVLLLNHVFLAASVDPPEVADLNCDGHRTPADVVLELNAVFLGQPPPCDP